MSNHRCKSQKSLITIRKWLLEAGDAPSSSIYVPHLKFDHNVKQKSHLNKIIKRKKFNNQNFYSKSTSIIDWLYEYIKKVFTVYDENPFKSNEQTHDRTNDGRTLSIMTCSTCEFENVDALISTIQSTLKTSKTSSSDLHSKTKPKMMVTIATSSCNLNTSQSTIFRSSKSTQTQANYNEQQSTIYPLYCFSVKDGQIVPLQFSFPSSSTLIPIVKQVISSSSPLCINRKKSDYCNSPIDSPVPLLPTDIHSYLSYQPTIVSNPSSHSNIISLQTTENFKEHNILSKVHRPSSSLHDTHIMKCYQSSNTEKRYPTKCHCSSNTNADAPEIVFAERTCQLIKQTWLSSTSH